MLYIALAYPGWQLYKPLSWQEHYLYYTLQYFHNLSLLILNTLYLNDLDKEHPVVLPNELSLCLQHVPSAYFPSRVHRDYADKTR